MIHKLAISFGYLLLTLLCNAQDSSWSQDEKLYYIKAKELCQYLQKEKYDTSKRDIIFDNYVLFVFPAGDSAKQRRLRYFDGLFYEFYHYVDSIGLQSLDAKPVRYFKNNTQFFKPFEGNLNSVANNCLAYFRKDDPDKPLGTLLFEPTTHKLAAWILLNMGGSYHYITSNMY